MVDMISILSMKVWNFIYNQVDPRIAKKRDEYEVTKFFHDLDFLRPWSLWRKDQTNSWFEKIKLPTNHASFIFLKYTIFNFWYISNDILNLSFHRGDLTYQKSR